MTTRHEANDEERLPPPFCVQRSGGAVVRHTPAGRFALPLSLYQGAVHHADVSLVMTAVEVEALHAELGCLLYPQGAGGAT